MNPVPFLGACLQGRARACRQPTHALIRIDRRQARSMPDLRTLSSALCCSFLVRRSCLSAFSARFFFLLRYTRTRPMNERTKMANRVSARLSRVIIEIDWRFARSAGTLLYSVIQSLVAFSLSPKFVTFNDLEWPFCVKLFCAGMTGAVKLGFLSLATLKLVVNVGEL